MAKKTIDQAAIIAELTQRIGKMKCPMCQHGKFILAQGFVNNTLQHDFASVSLGGPGIPAIPVVCENCGFISQHALGVLNLLPKGPQEEKSTK